MMLLVGSNLDRSRQTSRWWVGEAQMEGSMICGKQFLGREGPDGEHVGASNGRGEEPSRDLC